MAKSLKQLSDKIDARAKQPAKPKSSAHHKPSAPRDNLKKLRAHVDAIEQRLAAAQALSLSSVNAINTSFEKLQQNGSANEGITQLANHIDTLSNHFTDLIAQTRSEIAHDLQEVIADPRLDILSAALTKANQRLSKSEAEQRTAIDDINKQIAALSANVEEKIGAHIHTLETQSADAIKTIGDKIVDVSEDLHRKAETLRHEMGEKALHLVQSHEEHKADMAMRVEALEDDQRNTIPSLERRLVTLSTRIEFLETREPAQPEPSLPTEAYEDHIPPPYAKADGPPPASEITHDENAPYAPPIAPVQTDAFSPVEPVTLSQVTPPQNPYALTQVAGETPQSAAVEKYAPEEFVPEEFVPEAYIAPKTPPVTAPDIKNPIDDNLSHAPFNMQTGAFEQIDADINTGNLSQQTSTPRACEMEAVAPPPFDPTPKTPPIQDIDMHAQSMYEARPGAEKNTAKNTSLLAKFTRKATQQKTSGGGSSGGSKISSPVKTAALMVGVVVVGLYAAKTVLPKFMGGNTPTKTASIPTQKATAQQSTSSREVNSAGTAQQPRPIETIDTVGDYSDTMKAPNLGSERNGVPSKQKLTLEAAAIKGEPVAQFQLGLSHLEAGRDAQAVRLIQLAANQNQAAAQYRLGKLYEIGAGVKADPKTAMQWLERAANGGNRIAMHDLGHYYATGATGQANMGKAVSWFIKAAERGVLDSQFNLGVLYQGGAGVTKNLENAYVWYAIAGAQGDKVASQRSQLVAKDLKEEQLAGVIARVKNFKPTRINDAANGVFKDLPWTLSAPKTSVNNKAGGVKSAQSLLLSLGYDVGTPDGAMGPRTRNAVISFERANALPETGRVNAELLEKLNLAAGA